MKRLYSSILRAHARRALRFAALGLVAAAAGCAQNAGAARGPFPGFAQYEGRPVARVVFPDSTVLPVDSLQAVTLVRPPQCRIRFLPRSLCLTGTRRYDLDLTDLAGDVVRLILYHRDHGYYGTRVVPVVEPVGEEQVEVRFAIAPGDRVVLRQLAVEGAEAVVPDEQVLPQLPLREGEPFRRARFLATADTIRSILHQRGHAYANVLRNYAIDTIADVAEAEYVAIPGPVVRVDTIRILGADRVSRSTIMKQLAVREGEILQPAELIRSQRNLYQLSIVNFASVQLAPDSLQVDPDSTSATVVVRIVEAPKYVADVTGGYGTVDCLRTGARLVDRNFLGGGRTLELTASAAKIGVGAPLDFGLEGSLCRGLRGDLFSDQMTYRLATNFLQPRLLGTRTQLSANLHAERVSELQLYLRQAIGGQVTVSRDLGRGLLVGTGAQVERGFTQASPAIFCVLFAACAEEDQLPLREARWTNAATLSAALDRTRLEGTRTQGFQLRGNAAWASPLFLSDDRYLSVLGEAVAYRALSSDWVLAGRLQTGTFVTGSLGLRGGLIPPERRFYAGGPNSVRGFAANALGPQAYVVTFEDFQESQGDIEEIDERLVQRYPFGGTQVAVGSLEVRGPSPFLGQYLRLAAFVDAGQVWAPGLDVGDAEPSGATSGLAVTPGVGLRIATPVGPIRVDFGYNPGRRRAGPLYVAYEDERGQLDQLELIEPEYAPRIRSFLERLQLHIAVGQAF